MAGTSLFVFISSYGSPDDARADYLEVKQLHRDGLIHAYDAAVITKDSDGKVHISRHEKPAEYGGWAGLLIGGLVGLFFPPYLLWDAAIGTGAGALIGHLWKGLPRSDMKQIGEMLGTGTSALVVVGKSTLLEDLKKVIKRAHRHFEAQLTADTQALNDADAVAVNERIESASTNT